MYIRLKQKNMHKMGGGGGGVVKIRKAVCIQAVKVQVLCSGLRHVSESSTTPVGTAWMFWGATVKCLKALFQSTG